MTANPEPAEQEAFPNSPALQGDIARPKLVIFDWDNTLVDSHALIVNAHNHVRAQFGLDLLDQGAARRDLKYSFRETYPRIYGDKAPEAEKMLYDYVDAHHLADLRALPEAAALLDLLEGNGIPMAVASNKRGLFLRREVEALGWQGYFKGFVVGSGDLEKDKPDPVSVHHLTTRLAKAGGEAVPDPRDVWMIGDRDVDMIMGRAAGCFAVFYERDVRLESPDLADFSCRNPDDLFNLLKNVL